MMEESKEETSYLYRGPTERHLIRIERMGLTLRWEPPEAHIRRLDAEGQQLGAGLDLKSIPTRERIVVLWDAWLDAMESDLRQRGLLKDGEGY